MGEWKAIIVKARGGAGGGGGGGAQYPIIWSYWIGCQADTGPRIQCLAFLEMHSSMT